jgi:hypothetical protein
MTTKEEIKQKLIYLDLELSVLRNDANIPSELQPVLKNLVSLLQSVEKLDYEWRDATKELPELIPGKSYSETVFAKLKGFDKIQVMCLTKVQDNNGDWHYKWANCYGNIFSDGFLDDEYEVTEWKYIRF